MKLSGIVKLVAKLGINKTANVKKMLKTLNIIPFFDSLIVKKLFLYSIFADVPGIALTLLNSITKTNNPAKVTE